jgi:hypothetical protein
MAETPCSTTERDQKTSDEQTDLLPWCAPKLERLSMKGAEFGFQTGVDGTYSS